MYYCLPVATLLNHAHQHQFTLHTCVTQPSHISVFVCELLFRVRSSVAITRCFESLSFAHNIRDYRCLILYILSSLPLIVTLVHTFNRLTAVSSSVFFKSFHSCSLVQLLQLPFSLRSQVYVSLLLMSTRLTKHKFNVNFKSCVSKSLFAPIDIDTGRLTPASFFNVLLHSHLCFI